MRNLGTSHSKADTFSKVKEPLFLAWSRVSFCMFISPNSPKCKFSLLSCTVWCHSGPQSSPCPVFSSAWPSPGQGLCLKCEQALSSSACTTVLSGCCCSRGALLAPHSPWLAALSSALNHILVAQWVCLQISQLDCLSFAGSRVAWLFGCWGRNMYSGVEWVARKKLQLKKLTRFSSRNVAYIKINCLRLIRSILTCELAKFILACFAMQEASYMVLHKNLKHRVGAESWLWG